MPSLASYVFLRASGNRVKYNDAAESIGFCVHAGTRYVTLHSRERQQQGGRNRRSRNFMQREPLELLS